VLDEDEDGEDVDGNVWLRARWRWWRS